MKWALTRGTDNRVVLEVWENVSSATPDFNITVEDGSLLVEDLDYDVRFAKLPLDGVRALLAAAVAG